jgi:hypothetical protein
MSGVCFLHRPFDIHDFVCIGLQAATNKCLDILISVVDKKSWSGVWCSIGCDASVMI